MNVRKNHEMRMKAYDHLVQLKQANLPRKSIIDIVHNSYKINRNVLYDWYRESYKPSGRKGEITYNADLFYVIGALLGDGCPYLWRTTYHYIILVGDKKFATKFAEKLIKCTNSRAKAYLFRGNHIWYVRVNNYSLFCLFRTIRKEITVLKQILYEQSKEETLSFIEGFFDAEGCVKIIKEPVRETPKICLDICCTDFDYLELCRVLLNQYLRINAKFSAQKGSLGKDGYRRKTAYHLRIYKKEYVKKFFESISTIKLTKEKVTYTERWLRRKNKSTIELDCSFLQPASNSLRSTNL